MKKIIILILISIIIISCSKTTTTTTIAENSNWYLTEETNNFGKPIEYNITSQLTHIVNKSHVSFQDIWILIRLTEQDTVLFLIDVTFFDGIVDNEVEITFDNRKPIRLKSRFSILAFYGDESKRLISSFKKYNKVKIQGVGCKKFEIIDLNGFNDIYNIYLLKVISHKFG